MDGMGIAMCTRRLLSPLTAAALSIVLSLPWAVHASNLDLAAQPLDQALRMLGNQTKLNVLFEVAQVQGRLAPAVSGAANVDEVLSRLLAGTGLTYRFIETDTVSVVRMALPTDKTGAEVGEVSSALQLAQNAEMQRFADEKKTPRAVQPVSEKENGEMTVTGSHIRGAAPASPLINITREDITKSGYSSAAQVIGSLPQNFNGGTFSRIVPGATEFAPSLGTSSPSLRGLGDTTLTLVNGHRLSRTTGYQGSDLSVIPLAVVKRVEIIPDGSSSIYGADAIAGVINFILDDEFKGIQVGAQFAEPTRGGGGEQRSYSAIGGQSWNTGNLVVSYEKYIQNPLLSQDRDFSAPLPDPTELLEGFNRDNVTAFLNYRLTDSLSLYLDSLYSRRTADQTTNPTGTFLTDTDYSGKQHLINVGATKELAKNWLITLNASSSRDDAETHNVSTNSIGTRSESISLTDMQSRSTELSLTGNVFRLPAGNMAVAIGAGYLKEKYNLGLPFTPNFALAADRDVKYGYAELQIPIVGKDAPLPFLQSLDFTASVRHDKYSDFGDTSNPKFGFAYRPLSNLKIRGTWGESFRAPRFSELYASRTALTFPAIDGRSGSAITALVISGGNASLKSESADTWTVGIDYTPSQIDGLSISSTYFRYDYTDKVAAPTFPGSFFNADLSTPGFSPYVTFGPSQQLLQSLISGVAVCANFSCSSPPVISAFLESRVLNLAKQQAHGVDFQVEQQFQVATGTLGLTANAAYLRLKRQPANDTPFTQISGRTFSPSEWRVRSGASYSRGGLTGSFFGNYVSGSQTTFTVTPEHVESILTWDVTVSYGVPDKTSRLFSGVALSLSLQNALDKDPPGISSSAAPGYVGLGYDSIQASPLGRVVNLRLTKNW